MPSITGSPRFPMGSLQVFTAPVKISSSFLHHGALTMRMTRTPGKTAKPPLTPHSHLRDAQATINHTQPLESHINHYQRCTAHLRICTAHYRTFKALLRPHTWDSLLETLGWHPRAAQTTIKWYRCIPCNTYNKKTQPNALETGSPCDASCSGCTSNFPPSQHNLCWLKPNPTFNLHHSSTKKKKKKSMQGIKIIFFKQPQPREKACPLASMRRTLTPCVEAVVSLQIPIIPLVDLKLSQYVDRKACALALRGCVDFLQNRLILPRRE